MKSIEFVASIESEEATKLLIWTLEHDTGYGIKESFRSQTSDEQSTIIAQYAGQALARRVRGVDYLCKTIEDSSAPRSKRLLALSCFAKIESQRMLETLTVVLRSKDFEIVRIALKLIHQSEGLYNLSFFDDIPNDIASRAYGLFLRHITKQDIDELADLIASTKDVEFGERLLTCLLETDSKYASQKLAQLLGTDLREPAWYNLIASALLKSECKESHEMARAVCSIPLKDKLHAALNPSFRKRLIRRTVAASKVVGNHLPAGFTLRAMQAS